MLGASNSLVETPTYPREEVLGHIAKIPNDPSLEDAILLGRRHPAQLFRGPNLLRHAAIVSRAPNLDEGGRG